MLNKLPQFQETLIPNSVVPQEAVDYISSYIDKHSCEKLNIDISLMNVIDACYVSTLCATKHFMKYPNGRINWKVASKMIKEFNKDLNLGNSYYTC